MAERPGYLRVDALGRPVPKHLWEEADRLAKVFAQAQAIIAWWESRKDMAF